MAKINKVLYNIDQTDDTTANEKAQARANIGASQITYDSSLSDMTITKEIVRPYMNTKYTATVGNDSFLLLPSVFSDGMVVKSNGSLTTNALPKEVPSGGSNGQVLTWNNDTYGWSNPTSGAGVSMASFRSLKTIHIPAGNSSMINDLYKIYDLAPKTAVNMTVFVRDMDRNGLQMMGISIWCGTVEIDANSFTRGSGTSISHALPICYYNGGDSSIEIKIGFNGTFAEEDLEIEMMGFTISQGT